MGFSQSFGPGFTPYQYRFEPLQADGGATIVPASGTVSEGPKDPRTGRLMRCDFRADMLSRFFGIKAFGMDAGVPRETNNAPFPGAGFLNLTATFGWNFRIAVASDIFNFFLDCDASFRFFVEEFDQSGNFLGFTIPATFNAVSHLRPEGFLPAGMFRTIPSSGGAITTILNGRVPTVANHFYRVWTDVMIGITVHGGGIVRFNVGVNFAAISFSHT